MKEKYPIGLQTFSEIIENQEIYVDKTPLIFRLAEHHSPKAYFLSRPRRFGKSLLISTLKAIFEGRQALFKDCYLHDKIEWKRYPIIHLSMDAIGFQERSLRAALSEALASIAEKEGITLAASHLGLEFQALIQKLYQKYQTKVVILIDEYDKPITYGLEQEDAALAEKNRDIMKILYSPLKSADAYIRFLFITGISKFAKVSIFSDLNHLIDLSLDADYATLCGYTQSELMHYFPQGIARLAERNKLKKEEVLAKIKDWYNGFSWDGENFVYNPFSTLLLFHSGQFSNYWFESGTPTFLVKILNKNWDYQLENIRARSDSFYLYDFRNLSAKALLLQTGYLTIKFRKEEDVFVVDFPNKEVKQAFNEIFLGK